MHKLGIAVVCFALLAAGLLFLKQEAKDPAPKPATSLAGVDTENFASWKEFTPRSGLFKVLLPHPPQYAKDVVPTPGNEQKRRYDMYASEKIDGTAFLITLITYPNEPKSAEIAALLKQTVDELTRSKPDNHLSKSQETLFHTYPAMDFLIDNGKLKVEGKVFVMGKLVYVLSYVAQEDQINPGEFQHFIDSFEPLTPASATKP